MRMIILGIETSCDETGLALYCSERGLLGHVLYSQAAQHAEFGGVIPELASRDHIRKLTPLLQQLLSDTAVSRSSINAIAYTAGPGLMGPLMAGSMYARTLAWTWGIPSIPVHHMEGHLLAPMLEANPPEFPFLALLVSGGHTLLAQVNGIGQYRVLGESLDDAAGEAFDKTAKILGLGYPGGPALAKLAEQGTPGRFSLPRPMVNRPGFDFSFSGLKTHTVTLWQTHRHEANAAADIALAFEEAIVDTLCIKSERALAHTKLSRCVVAGGVGANRRLREQLRTRCQRLGVTTFYPRLEFCTDNGAMIAYAGWARYQHQLVQDTTELKPRWPLTTESSRHCEP